MASATSPIIYASTLNVYATTNTASLSADTIVATNIQTTSGSITGLSDLSVTGPLTVQGATLIDNQLSVSGLADFTGLVTGQTIECIELRTTNFTATGASAIQTTTVTTDQMITGDLLADTASIGEFTSIIVAPSANLTAANIATLNVSGTANISDIDIRTINVLSANVTGTLSVSGTTKFQSVNCTSINITGGIDINKTVFNVINVSEANIASGCLLYTSPSPRDRQKSRMPSSA